MTKLIKKSKCSFKFGHIVKNGELIGIPYEVWAQLNKLEIMAQQYAYLKDQKPYCAGPSLEGFERASALTSSRPYVDVPDTPVTDRRVAEAMEFMAEVDAVADAEKINETIDEFGYLIDWCSDNKFVEGTCFMPIDTPIIGNPLHLKADEIAYFIRKIVTGPIKIEG